MRGRPNVFISSEDVEAAVAGAADDSPMFIDLANKLVRVIDKLPRVVIQGNFGRNVQLGNSPVFKILAASSTWKEETSIAVQAEVLHSKTLRAGFTRPLHVLQEFGGDDPPGP
jgi:hypothetical protein